MIPGVPNVVVLGLIVAIIVIGFAWLARRNPALQKAALEVLPDSGDALLLKIQQHIPDDAELRDKMRKALDEAEAKSEEIAAAYLKRRGYSVSKSGLTAG